MNYIGIDLHKKFSQVTVLGENGEIKEKVKIENKEKVLNRYFNNFDEPSKAVIEATFSWGWLADYLKSRKIEVVLAHPQKVKAIASSQIKTDKVDSLILAKLLRSDMIPTAYLCPKPLREIKEVLRSRASLVGLKTQIKNKIHALLHKYNIQEDEEFSDLFGKKGRQFLNSLNLGEYSTAVLKRYLDTLEFLENQIEKTNVDLKAVFDKDETAKFLERLPGIGLYTALTLSKEIGDINRFFSAKHLCSYAGLVPSTYQSGEHTRHGRIKEGNKYIRWLLIEAVPKAIKKDKVLFAFYERIKKKKGANKAKVATARKMLAQIFYLLKTKKVFIDPKTGSPVFFSGGVFS
jgi:transposase